MVGSFFLLKEKCLKVTNLQLSSMNIFTEYQLNSKSIAYWVMILMIDIKLNIFVFFLSLERKQLHNFCKWDWLILSFYT